MNTYKLLYKNFIVNHKPKICNRYTPEKEMHMLQFKISDTGCGIKDEAKSFIFSDSQETSGVGLALTKRYIEAMNGTISFDSVYGAGTTFFINIPQKPIGTKQIAEDKQEDTKTQLPSLKSQEQKQTTKATLPA